MNDYEIVKYTESRFTKHTEESIKKFVTAQNPITDIIWGIFNGKNDRHIGNIKLGNIHPIHKYADIGFVLEKKEFWGHGIMCESVKLICDYGFDNLGLHSIIGGVYEPNIGSRRVFEKNGFSLVGTDKQKMYFEGRFIDCYHYQKIAGSQK